MVINCLRLPFPYQAIQATLTAAGSISLPKSSHLAKEPVAWAIVAVVIRIRNSAHCTCNIDARPRKKVSAPACLMSDDASLSFNFNLLRCEPNREVALIPPFQRFICAAPEGIISIRFGGPWLEINYPLHKWKHISAYFNNPRNSLN